MAFARLQSNEPVHGIEPVAPATAGGRAERIVRLAGLILTLFYLLVSFWFMRPHAGGDTPGPPEWAAEIVR